MVSEKKIILRFSHYKSVGVNVAMITRGPLQSVKMHPMQPFTLPDDALYEILSKLAY